MYPTSNRVQQQLHNRDLVYGVRGAASSGTFGMNPRSFGSHDGYLGSVYHEIDKTGKFTIELGRGTQLTKLVSDSYRGIPDSSMPTVTRADVVHIPRHHIKNSTMILKNRFFNRGIVSTTTDDQPPIGANGRGLKILPPLKALRLARLKQEIENPNTTTERRKLLQEEAQQLEQDVSWLPDAQEWEQQPPAKRFKSTQKNSKKPPDENENTKEEPVKTEEEESKYPEEEKQMKMDDLYAYYMYTDTVIPNTYEDKLTENLRLLDRYLNLYGNIVIDTLRAQHFNNELIQFDRENSRNVTVWNYLVFRDDFEKGVEPEDASTPLKKESSPTYDKLLDEFDESSTISESRDYEEKTVETFIEKLAPIASATKKSSVIDVNITSKPIREEYDVTSEESQGIAQDKHEPIPAPPERGPGLKTSTEKMDESILTQEEFDEILKTLVTPPPSRAPTPVRYEKETDEKEFDTKQEETNLESLHFLLAFEKAGIAIEFPKDYIEMIARSKVIRSSYNNFAQGMSWNEFVAISDTLISEIFGPTDFNNRNIAEELRNILNILNQIETEKPDKRSLPMFEQMWVFIHNYYKQNLPLDGFLESHEEWKEKIKQRHAILVQVLHKFDELHGKHAKSSTVTNSAYHYLQYITSIQRRMIGLATQMQKYYETAKTQRYHDDPSKTPTVTADNIDEEKQNEGERGGKHPLIQELQDLVNTLDETKQNIWKALALAIDPHFPEPGTPKTKKLLLLLLTLYARDLKEGGTNRQVREDIVKLQQELQVHAAVDADKQLNGSLVGKLRQRDEILKDVDRHIHLEHNGRKCIKAILKQLLRYEYFGRFTIREISEFINEHFGHDFITKRQFSVLVGVVRHNMSKFFTKES